MVTGFALVVCVLTGCRARSPLDPTPSLARQQEARLRAADSPDLAALTFRRYRRLLDFETPEQTVFVRVTPAASTVHVPPRSLVAPGHTGRASLVVPVPAGEPTRVTIRLASLVGTTPGDGWTLVGCYLRTSANGGEVTAWVDKAEGVEHALVPDTWRLVAADIRGTPPAAVVKRLWLRSTVDTEVWIDDVLLMDNAQTLEPRWGVRRAGHDILFPFAGGDWSLPHADVGGWKVVELHPLFARLIDAAGRTLTVHDDARPPILDGRSLVTGTSERLASSRVDAGGSMAWKHGPAHHAAHTSPAEVLVDESTGRIERTSPGDAEGDGYDESAGTYRFRASARRLDFRLVPTLAAIPAATVEVSGLPPGEVRVQAAGQAVDVVWRAADGRVVFRLPFQVDRDTPVSVRVR